MTSRVSHVSSPNLESMLTAVPATRTNRIRAQSSRSAAQMVKQANVDHNDNNNHDDDDDNTDFDDDADEHHDELLRLAQLHDDNDALDDAPPVVLSAPPLAAPSAAPPAAPHRTSAAKSFLNALTGRKKSKLPAAPKRSDRPGPRTSFTFAADEVDEDVALFGPDAASQHKSKKWFAWLSRLNPTAASPAPKASPRAVPARAAPAVAEADADAAAGTRLVAKSLDELPHEVRSYLNKCGLTDSNIRQHFWMVMAIIQFIGKIRVDNPWKEEQKKKTGNPGRDFRGSTDGLVRATDPDKFYKVYQSSPLGSGGFGTVLRGQRRSDTLPVAIKTMPNSSPKQKRENMWEVGLLHQSQHPNVVALYEAFDWAGAVWLVMERLEGGSLAHAVALSGGFREPHVAYASERVLVALEFMHKRNLVHRDLKSANLMFTTAGDVKIIDFGLCRDVSRAPGNSMLGSPFWMSPEMVRYEPHSTPTDIWSFAISLLEMINGFPPNHTCAVLALYKTATIGIDLSQWTFSAPLTDFLQRCLKFEPSKRATASELRKHEFLEKACDKEDMQNLIRQIFVQESAAAATASTSSSCAIKKAH